jgi:hypothetical protein
MLHISKKSGMHVSVAGVGAAMTASAACSPASFTAGVLALQFAAMHHVAHENRSVMQFEWPAWLLP